MDGLKRALVLYRVFMYFLHLVLTFTPHYIMMDKVTNKMYNCKLDGQVHVHIMSDLLVDGHIF